MSGTITYLHELVQFLERGGDADFYLDAEAVVPEKDRRNFGPGKTTTFLQEDGIAVMAYSGSTGIAIDKKEDIFHMGCGIEWVDGINPHCEKKLTPLECFVIASQYDSRVSEEFDYLDRRTGIITYDQKLTPRQRNKILDEVNSRFKLTSEVISSTYIN